MYCAIFIKKTSSITIHFTVENICSLRAVLSYMQDVGTRESAVYFSLRFEKTLSANMAESHDWQTSTKCKCPY